MKKSRTKFLVGAAAVACIALLVGVRTLYRYGGVVRQNDGRSAGESARRSAEQKGNASATATSTKKLVALTFDDGPYGTSTKQILDILKAKNVHATFFVLGMNVAKYPDEVRREIADGHLVGNHGYNHLQTYPTMSSSTFALDLLRTEEAIVSSTGAHPTWYRPPYGALSATMRQVLHDQGFRIALWNVDPEDWNYEKSSSTAIIRNVESHVRPDAIILMHDGRDTHINYPRDNTIRALPIIIDDLRARGYEFVTVDEIVK